MWEQNLASITYGGIQCCVAKGRDRARVDAGSKYSGETFGYFGKEQVIFVGALTLASLPHLLQN